VSPLWLVETTCIFRSFSIEYTSLMAFTRRHESAIQSVVLRGLSEEAFLNSVSVGKWLLRLQQTQVAGTSDRFGAPLNLELAKDAPIVSFHRIQGKDQPLANFLVRKSLCDKMEDF
jgi:hypothetical protein